VATTRYSIEPRYETSPWGSPRCRTPPAAPIARRPPRPALDVADIVRAHGAAYRREHALFRDQRAVLRAIATCRTPVLGGHLDVVGPPIRDGSECRKAGDI